MANLDPKYVIAPSLQMYFVDKDTGLPLSGGKVYFYENGTNIPKKVYEINGIGGTVTYTELTQPVELSAVGTFQDDTGNDIIPYYFPYDDNGDIQLYSIEVWDSVGSPGGVLQFTRDNWPNTSSSTVSVSSDITNFVPNGQFLLHDNVPASSANGYIAGRISATETNVAPGGWYFVRSSNSGTDNVTYTSLGASSGVDLPSDNPPYAVRVTRTGSFNDARTDLCLRFPDVNTFANNLDYNLYFNAESRSASNATVNIIINQYYGSGSSSSPNPKENPIGPQLIKTSYDPNGYNIGLPAGSFPSNDGKDIRPGNYVEIVIRLPLNTTFDLEFTDFSLTLGKAILDFYPPQAPAQQLAPSTAGSIPTPAYDGSDLYLPVKMGKNGFIIDHGEVGSVYGKFALTADTTTNELLMDGSAYVYANYSSLGIPYSRLGNFLIANSPAISIGGSTIDVGVIPLFGTGANFVTVLRNATPGQFDVSFNTSGGTNAVSDGTSGFSHTSADPLYVFTVPGTPAANSYWSFTSHDNKVYNVWYSVDGSSVPPATPTGANIQVSIASGAAVATVITATVKAVNQYQFAILDARGYFWRGLDTGTSVDPDSATRTMQGITDNSVAQTGANLGSFETDVFTSHTHSFAMQSTSPFTYARTPASDLLVSPTGLTTTSAPSTGSGSETRPVNLAINWFIKY